MSLSWPRASSAYCNEIQGENISFFFALLWNVKEYRLISFYIAESNILSDVAMDATMVANHWHTDIAKLVIYELMAPILIVKPEDAIISQMNKWFFQKKNFSLIYRLSIKWYSYTFKFLLTNQFYLVDVTILAKRKDAIIVVMFIFYI